MVTPGDMVKVLQDHTTMQRLRQETANAYTQRETCRAELVTLAVRVWRNAATPSVKHVCQNEDVVSRGVRASEGHVRRRVKLHVTHSMRSVACSSW